MLMKLKPGRHRDRVLDRRLCNIFSDQDYPDPSMDLLMGKYPERSGKLGVQSH